jgi:hypothetical protein
MCYVSLVLDICCVLYVGSYRSVLQCGLLRIVFVCWHFLLVQRYGLCGCGGSVVWILGKAGFCLVEGYGVGDLWLVGIWQGVKDLIGGYVVFIV